MKKIIHVFLVTVIICSLTSISAFSDVINVKSFDCMILYNNNLMNFTGIDGEEIPLFEYNDMVYVPLRSFNEQIGNSVEWNSSIYSSEIKIDSNNHKYDILKFGDYNREGDTIEVSIINLISNPEKYLDKRVRVQGILNIDFETDYLFLTNEDRKFLNFKNGIPISINNVSKLEVLGVEYDELKKVTGRYCTIEGNFVRSQNDGEGFLNNINLIESDIAYY